MRVVRVRVTVVGRGPGERVTQVWVRGLLLVVAVCFLWLQLHVSSLAHHASSVQTTTHQPQHSQNNTALILSMVPQMLHKFLTVKPRNSSRTSFNSSLGNSSVVNDELSIEEILRSIEKYNTEQIIHNEEIYGPIQNDTLIIVIQVHTRIVYLRHLIVSLAQARDIETCLIIFSHDHFDPEANELVQSVDFARVMQIFYPLSIQTHPDTFPGQSLGDCPRDINIAQAKRLECINADHPDLYGHYREAKFTQTKHHWWWKANRVFNQLEVTRNHSGLVLFLEEDHYVAEDFIYVLKQMQIACSTECPQVNIFSLGTYLKTYNYYSTSKKAEITPWISSKHNMGMAFNRSVWAGLHACAKHFCRYDDYNWDWSLQQVSQQCLQTKLTALVMRSPRVFHIGECGVHHKKNNCESVAVISKVQKVLAAASRHLYPSYLSLSHAAPSAKKTKLRKGNGGWGDIRDHQLCLNFTLPHR